MSQRLKTFLFCSLLVAFAVSFRIISMSFGWHNFATMAAVGLFSGAVFKNKPYAALLPLIAFLLTDFYIQMSGGIGFYGITQYFVYGSMVLVVLLGSSMKRISSISIFGYAIGSSLLFYIVSNFGVWFAGCLSGNGFVGTTYSRDLNGLIQCYVMGIPFYKYTLVSDLLFSFVLFGSYALYQVLNKQQVKLKMA